MLSVDGARQISVSGHGEASADPDTVILSLCVSVLRDQGVEEDDIQTTNLTVFPEFDFSRDKERELHGFRVSNQVSASPRDVDAASALIDAAAKVGATT